MITVTNNSFVHSVFLAFVPLWESCELLYIHLSTTKTTYFLCCLN